MRKPILFFFIALLISMIVHGQDSLFLGSEKPGTNETDNAVELGVVIRPSVDGFVRWVKYYKTIAADTATVQVTLWDYSGNLLFAVFNQAPGKIGWQRVRIPGEILMKAGTNYVVSCYIPSGRYGQKIGAFASARTRGIITAPASATVGGNGRYRYGPGFPTQTFNNASYLIDVVFEKDQPRNPLLVSAGPDTLLKYPTDSFRLQGIATGDEVSYKWTNPNDSLWSSTSLNPVVKPLSLQHYQFDLTATDRWGNSMTSSVNLTVVRPIMLILSDGSWFLIKTDIIVDPEGNK